MEPLLFFSRWAVRGVFESDQFLMRRPEGVKVFFHQCGGRVPTLDTRLS